MEPIRNNSDRQLERDLRLMCEYWLDDAEAEAGNFQEAIMIAFDHYLERLAQDEMYAIETYNADGGVVNE